jgi:predicted nucleic acid-binding protein
LFDAMATCIPNPPRRIGYLRDPNDEPVLNLAVHVEAHYILTRDKDLLSLADDVMLRRHFPSLQILDPVAFLEKLPQG